MTRYIAIVFSRWSRLYLEIPPNETKMQKRGIGQLEYLNSILIGLGDWQFLYLP